MGRGTFKAMEVSSMGRGSSISWKMPMRLSVLLRNK